MYIRDLAKISTIPERSIIMYSPLHKTHVPVCCTRSYVPVPTCTMDLYAGLDAMFMFQPPHENRCGSTPMHLRSKMPRPGMEPTTSEVAAECRSHRSGGQQVSVFMTRSVYTRQRRRHVYSSLAHSICRQEGLPSRVYCTDTVKPTLMLRCHAAPCAAHASDGPHNKSARAIIRNTASLGCAKYSAHG